MTMGNDDMRHIFKAEKRNLLLGKEEMAVQFAVGVRNHKRQGVN